MASKTSKAEANKAVPLAEFVADTDRRQAETRITDLPRNSASAARRANVRCSRR